jgi:NADH dehydrogenase
MNAMNRADGGHIVVDGATGYLGTHLTAKLLEGGFPVRCLVHPGANRADMELLRKMGAEVYIGNLNQSDENSPVVTKCFNGAVAGVHLVGSVAPRKGADLDELHAGQSHWFAQQAFNGGVGRVVMVTTLGTTSDAKTNYQRTKWAAEQIVSAAGMPYTILKPSLIVGRTVGKRDSKLIKRYLDMIAKKAVVPVIAGGHNKIQPVFVNDVVAAICRCIFPGRPQREATGKALEIGGPEVLEMRQFISMLMETLEKRKPIVPLPPPFAYATAMFCEQFQKVPTVSRDQVTLSMSDNVCSDNALHSILGIEPTPLEVALQSYADTAKNPVTTGAKS